ncbi:DUF3551 domain-containing protein [Bradyrhizobium yuanmingense]|uniref:DUF3551 domain-containing protein n=1 Tax=Bradyrhizobium yuanmingense TaxID=108015 RepID=UPI0023EC8CF0|nr:DUF3551 domain-containing protein [Bradyrhizobium yuanmingense]
MAYTSTASFSTCSQCMAAASGTIAACGLNPTYAFKEWKVQHGDLIALVEGAARPRMRSASSTGSDSHHILSGADRP